MGYFFQRNSTRSVESETGQWAEYFYKDSHYYKRLLTSVKRSCGPSIEYEYFFPRINSFQDSLGRQRESYYRETHEAYPPRITKKKYEGGKYRRMQYRWLERGLPTPWPGPAPLKREHSGNLTAYYGPVGENGKEEEIYKLEYLQDKTIVTHGDGKCEEYELAKNSHMLVGLVEKDKTGKKQRQKKWFFSQDGGRGLLQRELLKGERDDEVVRQNTFEYDAKGNLVKQITYGSIEKNSRAIVDSNGFVSNKSNCGSYEVSYKYGEGPLYLKKEEIYPGGRRLIFQHEEETDKITAQLLLQGEEILERHFFSYNFYGQATLEIHDDGSTYDRDNLEGVFHRAVIQRQYHEEGPLSGLLLKEQLYLFDSQNQQEILNNEAQFSYDACRRLIRKTATEFVLGNVTEHHYEYDEGSRLVREVDERGAVVERCFEVDNLLKWEKGPDPKIEKFYTCDADRRPLTCTEKHADYPQLEWVTTYKHDVMGRLSEIVDPFGVRVTNTYDWAGRIVSQTRSRVLNSTSSGFSEYEKQFKYDANDRKIFEANEVGERWACTYNVLGKPLRIRDFKFAGKCFYYDSNGRLSYTIEEPPAIPVQNSLSLKEYYFYDPQGRHIRTDIEMGGQFYGQISFEYEGAYKSAQTDVLGHRDFWKYDGLGRVIQHIRLDIETGAEAKEEFVYDGFGREITYRTFQDKLSYTENHKRYNAAGDIVEKWVENSIGERFCYTRHTYNEIGKCIRVEYSLDGEIISSETEFDSFGNIILAVDQEGYRSEFLYEYHPGLSDDGIAVIVYETRPDGAIDEKWLSYDSKQICHKLYDAQGVLRQHQWFGYDGSGQLVYRKEQALATEGSTSLDQEPTWVQTKLEYELNRTVLKRFDNYQSELERVHVWKYNYYGQCVKKTEPSGLNHFYTYDTLGYMTTCTSSDGTIDYSYEHDKIGRTLKVTNNITGKSTIRAYDAWGRITRDESEEGHVFEQEWNALGQPTKDVYPDGSTLTRQYEGGLLRQTQVAGYSHQIKKYNSQALAILEEQPHDLGNVISNFDCKKRLTEFELPGYRASEVVYNEMGHLTRRLLEGGQTQNYEYDLLGQLKKEEGTCLHTYEHDSRNRRIAQDDQQIVLDDLNQLFSITPAHGTIDQVEKFDYDIDGHLIRRIMGDQVWEYTYDAWSRLTSVKGPNFTTTYSHDAFNRRLQATYKTAGSVQQKQFAYLGQMLACIYEAESVEMRYFVRASSSERGDTLLWRHGEDVYMPIHDMAGSCIGWRDLEGVTVASWSFDSFGNCLGTQFGPWGCWGKYKDPLTGMVYFGLRDYIPSQGRWLTHDPKGEIDGSNLYAYVANNPVTRCDEWGAMMITNDLPDFISRDTYYKGNHVPNMESSYQRYEITPRDAYEDLNSGYRPKGSVLVIARYEGSDKNRNGPLVGINGIGTPYSDAVKDSIKKSQEAKTDVYHVYNYSLTEKYFFGIIADGIKAFLQRNGAEIITGAEKVLVITLQLIDKEYPNKDALLNPHSHGHQVLVNVETYLAEKENIKPILARCHVSAMAGSGCIKNSKSFASYQNTVCKNDFVIRLFDGGAINKQREMNVLIEPEPIGKGLLERLIPDHCLNGPTCQNAYYKALEKWNE